ncbi:FG-GAP repeat protein, partial [Patescibacteria group bacterium]
MSNANFLSRHSWIIVAAVLLVLPFVTNAATFDLSLVEKFTGTNADANAGAAIAVGDLNNDGYQDMVLGDAGATTNGTVYVQYGQSALFSTASLSTADVAVTGEAAGDLVGGAVAVCDVNGDGYDDFLAGSPSEDSGGTNAGVAYLVYGQAADLTLTDFSSADAKFIGERAEDAAGLKLGCGDINGDGYADVFIGASGEDTVADLAGAIYLLYGGEGNGLLLGDTDLSTADAMFTGESGYDAIPDSLATGDVNGDGYDDLVVGAKSGSTNGSAYLIYGQSALYSQSLNLSSVPEFTGETAGDDVGVSLATGDFNNDGYDDILIGADRDNTGGSSAGAVYLLNGGEANMTSKALANADAKYIGETTGDRAGYSVGSGDFNADGVEDILIGAWHESTGGTEAGASYVVYGAAASSSAVNYSPAAVTATDLSGADVKLTGETDYDRAGATVVGGDVNGDDYYDILVGAT